MARAYEEVILRMGESMYHQYMGGGSPSDGLKGVELVSFIYGVPADEIRAAAHEVYEAHGPANEEPA